MYRVFLFIAFLAYCSSVPFTGPTLRRQIINQHDDDSDLVDSIGGGYSYFKKQDIQARPLVKSPIDMPGVDLSAYFQGSAFKQLPIQNQIFSPGNNQIFSNGFGQQQLIPRSNIPIQNLLPKTIQIQQPPFIQKDFSQFPSTISNGYNNQQANFPTQSRLLATNTFNNPQQIRFNGYGNQQQDFSFVPQPQQTWNTQQQSVSFSSSFGGQGQQPVSSGFLIESNQQNDQPPVTNVVFMSSQIPPQHFMLPSQAKQQITSNGY